MSDNSASIVSKVWNYAHVLKNAGVGYGDYIEVRAARALITYLLFLKLAPPPLSDAVASCEMSERGSCQLKSFLEGSGGEGLDGGKPAGSELFGGEQGRGIGSDVLQSLAHFLELEDSFQELEFVDERPLSDASFSCFAEQPLNMRGKNKRKHPDVLFILTADLIEPEEAAAFALEEKDRVDHADFADYESPFHEPGKGFLRNAVNRGHEIHGKHGRSIQGKDAQLPVGGGGSDNKLANPGFGADVLERSIAYPDIAILGGEGAERCQIGFGFHSAVEFRPEVNCLPTSEKIVGFAVTEIPKKGRVVADPGFRHDQRPMACSRFEMRASLKNSSGKMEFSRCKTAGSSPALRRSSSARRDAHFSASRDSRLNFSDGFMAAG